MLNYGAPSWVYGEITEFVKQTDVRERPFRYRHSFMYAAVRVINYIAESVASWEKENGSVAKLWATNIRFGYCAILTVRKKRALSQRPIEYVASHQRLILFAVGGFPYHSLAPSKYLRRMPGYGRLAIASYCESTCNQFIIWQFLHTFLCIS